MIYIGRMIYIGIIIILIVACSKNSELKLNEQFKINYSKSDNSLLLNVNVNLDSINEPVFFEVIEYDTLLGAKHSILNVTNDKEHYKVRLDNNTSYYKAIVTNKTQSEVFEYLYDKTKFNLKYSETPILQMKKIKDRKHYQINILNSDYSQLSYLYYWINNQVDEDNIENDYEFIKKIHNDNYKTALLISYFCLKDNIDSVEYYLGLLPQKNYKDIYNHSSFVNLLINYINFKNDLQKKVLKIAQNYPKSYLSKRIIQYANDLYSGDDEMELFTLYNKIKQNNNHFLSILPLTSYILNNNLYQYYEYILSELYVIYNTMNKKHFFEKGLDKDRVIVWQKHNIYTKMVELNIRLKQNIIAKQYIQEVFLKFPPFDNLLTITYHQKAIIFQSENKLDSALINYVRSCKLDPSFPFSKDSLLSFHRYHNITQKFDKWLDSLKVTTKLHSVNLEYEIKERFNLGRYMDLENQTLMIFISKRCSICDVLISDLSAIETIIDNKNILFVTQDDINEIYFKIQSNGIENPKLIHSERIIDFFNIKAFPVIALLDNKFNLILFNRGYSSDYGLGEILGDDAN